MGGWLGRWPSECVGSSSREQAHWHAGLPKVGLYVTLPMGNLGDRQAHSQLLAGPSQHAAAVVAARVLRSA